MRTRPRFFGIVSAMLGLCCATGVGGCHRDSADSQTGKTPRPVDEDIRHLIVISLDTLRADFLSIYGHPFVKTPHIDNVAAEGIVFEQHVNCAPTTLASHTSLFTGQYPHHHGVPRNGFVVNDQNVMLPEVLKDYGFTTAAFLGSYALASAFNFHQGFDFFDETFDVARARGAVVAAERYADDVTDAVLRWLDKNRTERMFLFVHYFDIHSPYTPPPPYDKMYHDPAWKFTGRDLNMDRLRQEILAGGPRDRPEVNALQALYAGEITFTDHELGRLLAALDKRGILDKSLVVITSDHGETFTEHRDLFNHGQEVYETTVWTPLIVRFPGGRHGGRREARLVSNVDVMPTLLEWLGIPGPDRMDGLSFAAVLQGGLPERDPVFAEATQPRGPQFESHPVWKNSLKSRCVRTLRWKLIRRPLGPKYLRPVPEWEFYDLQADRNEKKDLLAGGPPADEALVNKLRDALADWDARADPLDSEPEMSDHATRALKHLGYAR